MKVGEYVRTNYGTIFQIENMVEIDVDGTWFKSKVKENSIIKDLPRFKYHEEDEIINKASQNIIDLIEVGDYVNGKLVTHAEDVYTTDNIYIGKEVFVNYEELIIEEDIKSIVTREQFSQMEYKVNKND